MKRQIRGLLSLTIIATSVACSPGLKAASLGKVVVYRNGVAYFERNAAFSDGKIQLSVPRDKVDDFLKSLTVKDAESGEALPVSFPSQNRSGSVVEITIAAPLHKKNSRVVLTYVSDSPAWKPSYRATLGDDGNIHLQGWAVVDNTSGEDWKDVLVGVGSSSAMSFKYDLWSIRNVNRQSLGGEQMFAIAPPTGTSPYNYKEQDKQIIAALSNQEALDMDSNGASPSPIVTEDAMVEAVTLSAQKSPARDRTLQEPTPEIRRAREKAALERKSKIRRKQQANQQLKDLSAKINGDHDGKYIVEGLSSGDENTARRMANILRSNLISAGVAPEKVSVRVGKAVDGQPTSTRIVRDSISGDENARPRGESHFESTKPISVEDNGSAMVSVMNKDTKGRVVYLFDRESTRGNGKYAFKALRFFNPTESTLEFGPVTVYGKGRFIGEGLTEAVSPGQSAMVPFALDHQIFVEVEQKQSDVIKGVNSVFQGWVDVNMQRIRTADYKVKNRLHEATTVYVRHTIAKGWNLESDFDEAQKLGTIHYIPVKLEAGEEKTLTVSQSTPIEFSLNLKRHRDVVRLATYLAKNNDAPQLTKTIKDIDRMFRDIENHRTKITIGEQKIVDYKKRQNELHLQLLSLKMVKSSGKLVASLKQKMIAISERIQNETIALVEHRDAIAMTRVSYLETIAELSYKPISKDKVAAVQ